MTEEKHRTEFLNYMLESAVLSSAALGVIKELLKLVVKEDVDLKQLKKFIDDHIKINQLETDYLNSLKGSIEENEKRGYYKKNDE